MTYNTARRKPITKKQRPIFLARNGGVCIFCGQPITEGEPWQDCHVIAREMGGSDDWENRWPGHVACHKEDTRRVAKLIAKSNRLRRANGAPELRRKTPHPIRTRKTNWPKRSFPKRASK